MNQLAYLKWHKRLPGRAYNLAVSGVPNATLEDLGLEIDRVEVEVRGAYGDPRLREAVGERYVLKPENVLPVAGASSGIFIALAASTRRGDTVLVESPVYDPVRRSAAFLGLNVEHLARRPDRDFVVDSREVVQAVESCNPSAVVLTNLHNPSGQRTSRETVAELARACHRAGAALIVDEVYLDSYALVFDGPRWSVARYADEYRVLAVNSLTKLAGLSGLRCGWLAGSPDLIERAADVMDLLNVNNAAPSTSLALQALTRSSEWERRFKAWRSASRPLLDDWLARESRVSSYPDHGALFACLRLPEDIDADEFVERLARDFDTQVVPGRFFDLPGHVRIGLGVPEAELAGGLAAISRALDAVG